MIVGIFQQKWIYRWILRIPWTAHMSNKEQFTMIGNKQLLLNIVKQRQVAYLGHIIPKDGPQGLLEEGQLNRKSGRERSRALWMENIKEWTKLSYTHFLISNLNSGSVIKTCLAGRQIWVFKIAQKNINIRLYKLKTVWELVSIESQQVLRADNACTGYSC